MAKMEIDGVKELKVALNGMRAALGKDVADGLWKAGEKVRGVAIRSIQTQTAGSTQVRYRNGGNSRMVVASKAGDPPNTDTGQLVRNIHAVIVDRLDVAVGTSLQYGAYLEVGTSKMKPRPWLIPALNEVRPKIDDYVIDEMNATIKRRT